MNASGRPVVIYGAGGHGRVVLDALERGGYEVIGFLDDDPDRRGSRLDGYPVLGDLGAEEIDREIEVIVAIGDCRARERVTRRVLERGFRLAAALHPTAVIARRVDIGEGVMVLASAAINPGTRLGRGAIINTGASVDHDCDVGAFAHIAPGVSLAGGVKIGDRALVGVGASVVPGVEIGADAVVAAGAAVIGPVGAGMTVAGVPAKAVSGPRRATG